MWHRFTEANPRAYHIQINKGHIQDTLCIFFISLSEFIHVKHNQDTPSGSCWPDNPSAVRAHTELDHLAKR